MIVSIDFETRSLLDLPRVGLDRYARDPSTEVICMAYSLDNAEPQLWLPGQPLPKFLSSGTDLICAWNAAFEVNIIRHVLGLDARWENFLDTMAVAAANNVPQSLEEAAIFLGLSQQKDPVGRRLIQKLSKPNARGQFNMDPELLAQMYEYCRQDVRAEMAVAARLRTLQTNERALWALTQRINDRGVPVRPEELQNAIRTAGANREKISEEMRSITGGAGPSQPGKILEWLRGQGVEAADLRAQTVEEMLRAGQPPLVRRVLELRQQGSLTSVAKYEKMLQVQVGGRVRNTLVYHGASTGRFASRGGLNLQNLPRPHYRDDQQEALDEAIGRVLVEGRGGTMEELSSLVRSAIRAPDGYVFVDADFSSIENRVASWIAGQNDKLELFRQGLDEYKTFASKSLYDVPYDEVTKEMRQVAKSAVLGCMFGQGAKGLVRYAKGMGVEMDEERSKEVVEAYRSDYHMVRSCWYGFESAALDSVRTLGGAFQFRGTTFKCQNRAMWVRLPSGRLICWQDPAVEPKKTPWGAERDTVTVRGQDTFTRKWERYDLIGSSMFQSVVQATARDFLADVMVRLDDEGYDVINTVHDEVLLLVPEKDGDSALGRVVEIMTTPPKWAEGFPLAAEGWFGDRYRK